MAKHTHCLLTALDWTVNCPLNSKTIADCQRESLSPLDGAWAFATAIININTGENYTVNDVKKMDAKGRAELLHPPKTSKGDYEKGGANELARRTGISDFTIREHLKLVDLELGTDT